jgi:hypothetical protein
MAEKKKICRDCKKEIKGRKSPLVKYCIKCIRKREYTKYANKYIREKTKQRAKYIKRIHRIYDRRCAICGWIITLGYFKNKWFRSGGNEIHHIKSIKDGGTDIENNLILLCPNHHKLAHAGVITKEQLKEQLKFEITGEDPEKLIKKEIQDIVKNLDIDKILKRNKS